MSLYGQRFGLEDPGFMSKGPGFIPCHVDIIPMTTTGTKMTWNTNSMYMLHKLLSWVQEQKGDFHDALTWKRLSIKTD